MSQGAGAVRFPLIVTCRRSTWVLLFVASVHLGGVIAIFAAAGAADAVRLAASVLVLVSLGSSLRAWHVASGQFRLTTDGGCEYRPAADEEFQTAECRWSTVWPQLAVAGFRLPGTNRNTGFVLIAGVLPAEEMRLVRVWLLNCHGKSA